ncbi:IS66 family transposase [Teichococcus aestuarii]|uniref:IS66 family transposase n=1 Tax=Teichococcus aestuarii TaxID=568898 RepID=UPI003461B487
MELLFPILCDGQIDSTNNAAERAFRSAVHCRKTWLLAGSNRGSKRRDDLRAYRRSEAE